MQRDLWKCKLWVSEFLIFVFDGDLQGGERTKDAAICVLCTFLFRNWFTISFVCIGFVVVPNKAFLQWRP